MILAKVTGTVVSTQKSRKLESQKLLILRQIDPEGNIIGKEIVAVDTVQAGAGDTVLIIDEGGSAGIMLGMSSQPIRTVTAAIVDRVDMVKEGK